MEEAALLSVTVNVPTIKAKLAIVSVIVVVEVVVEVEKRQVER